MRSLIFGQMKKNKIIEDPNFRSNGHVQIKKLS